ncbi:MAG: agmatinase family protein [Bdellovibrionales bacterium]
MTFDPNATLSPQNGLFGLPHTLEQSRVVLLPVPWDVTTSYGGGTARGPETILRASVQLDLFDLEAGEAYLKGFHMQPIPEELSRQSQNLRPKALQIRQQLEDTGTLNESGQQLLQEINQACERMVNWVHDQTKDTLKRGKIPGLVGGDHSTPQGAIQAISEYFNGKFGILHIDAHADLRQAYQGFQYSHASIMHNVMHATWRPQKLVQVGVRDFCKEEYDLIRSSNDIQTFFDLELKSQLFAGTAWAPLCSQIVEHLPKQVYVSFDIDGLSPEFCPHTGTPVPGGLSFDQALFLIRAVASSGRRIIGFDLNEVAPGQDEWDGNVAARLLYKLCGWAVQTNKES